MDTVDRLTVGYWSDLTDKEDQVYNDLYNNLAYLVEACHEISKSKGFWEDREEIRGTLVGLKPPELVRDFELVWDLSRLALIHSEVSEALEELRSPTRDTNKVLEELADVVILTFNFARFLEKQSPIGEGLFTRVLLQKMAKNINREYKHRKKASKSQRLKQLVATVFGKG